MGPWGPATTPQNPAEINVFGHREHVLDQKVKKSPSFPHRFWEKPGIDLSLHAIETRRQDVYYIWFAKIGARTEMVKP